MVTMCGIDEAGRGPLLGPLVMAGVLVEDEADMKKLGVKDSKLLTKDRRESLYKEIVKVAKKYKIISVGPKEVDNAVEGHDGLNLNWLEGRKIAEIINFLKPDKAIIDAPSNNIPAFKAYLLKYINVKGVELVLEHKADLNYPSVSAASILAKVTRDNEIEKIKKKIKKDFGSGYMSDPKTADFLEKNFEVHKELFRKSWMPYRKMADRKNQMKLGSFSKSIEKVENKDKGLLDKLKKLEHLGYESIPVKTPYESVRLKGACTITLYKSGKLLVQGKEKDKKVIESILGKK